jgi:hypothetical protein
MTPQPIKVRADVEMTCFAYDGVEHIKAAMRAAAACSTPDCEVKIKLVAPPLYVLTTQTLDKAQASLAWGVVVVVYVWVVCVCVGGGALHAHPTQTLGVRRLELPAWWCACRARGRTGQGAWLAWRACAEHSWSRHAGSPLRPASFRLPALPPLLPQGIETLSRAVEVCKAAIEGSKGQLRVKEAARAVSEKEERALQEELEAAEAANRCAAVVVSGEARGLAGGSGSGGRGIHCAADDAARRPTRAPTPAQGGGRRRGQRRRL